MNVISREAVMCILFVFSPSPGDLKLVEKPSPLTLAPHDFANIKANVKVASTENGIIFGNIGEKEVCLPGNNLCVNV